MLYLLNSGVSFQSVPSVAIVGPELRYSWLLEVREIKFLHTIWIPLTPHPSPHRHGDLVPHLTPSEVLASAGFSMEECEAARHVIFEGLDVEPDNS